MKTMTTTGSRVRQFVSILARGVLTLVVFMGSAAATILTYNFQGVFNDSTVAQLPNGTAFSGSFSYDTASPVTSGGPNYSFYSGGTLSLAVGSSTVQTIGQRVIETDSNIGVSIPSGTYYNRDLLMFDNYIRPGTDTLLVTGPLASAGLQFAAMWFVLPLGTVPNGGTALPRGLPLRLDGTLIEISTGLVNSGSASGVFSGVSVTSSVPEPSTAFLAAFGLATLCLSRRWRAVH